MIFKYFPYLYQLGLFVLVLGCSAESTTQEPFPFSISSSKSEMKLANPLRAYNDCLIYGYINVSKEVEARGGKRPSADTMLKACDQIISFSDADVVKFGGGFDPRQYRVAISNDYREFLQSLDESVPVIEAFRNLQDKRGS